VPSLSALSTNERLDGGIFTEPKARRPGGGGALHGGALERGGWVQNVRGALTFLAQLVKLEHPDHGAVADAEVICALMTATLAALPSDKAATRNFRGTLRPS
jgi:hypothetical protein